jgi:hypothetical protein
VKQRVGAAGGSLTRTDSDSAVQHAPPRPGGTCPHEAQARQGPIIASARTVTARAVGRSAIRRKPGVKPGSPAAAALAAAWRRCCTPPQPRQGPLGSAGPSGPSPASHRRLGGELRAATPAQGSIRPPPQCRRCQCSSAASASRAWARASTSPPRLPQGRSHGRSAAQPVAAAAGRCDQSPCGPVWRMPDLTGRARPHRPGPVGLVRSMKGGGAADSATAHRGTLFGRTAGSPKRVATPQPFPAAAAAVRPSRPVHGDAPVSTRGRSSPS